MSDGFGYTADAKIFKATEAYYDVKTFTGHLMWNAGVLEQLVEIVTVFNKATLRTLISSVRDIAGTQFHGKTQTLTTAHHSLAP